MGVRVDGCAYISAGQGALKWRRAHANDRNEGGMRVMGPSDVVETRKDVLSDEGGNRV